MRIAGSILALGVLACTSAPRAGRPDESHATHAAPAAPAGADSASLAQELARGEQVVRTTCAACHTLEPPPDKAPPFAMIAMRYRAAAASDDEAIARIVAWVRAPDAERSLLPAMAIERFGLMPPLPLPDSLLRPAARYLLTLGGHGGMPQQHRGMQHGRPALTRGRP